MLIKLHRGNLLPTFSSPSSMLLLFLGFALCGLSEEIPMASVPLGSQISGHGSTTWLSQDGSFAFGFIPNHHQNDDGSGNVYDDSFVVGIFHNFPNCKEKIPVWSVGGGVRVSENSTLQLSPDGTLVLFDKLPQRVIWSSDTGNLGVECATLMTNGNLVLMGFGGRTIWESFTSPTDTLLPGQPLHYTQTLRAASADSIASYYSLVVKSFGEISLVWEGNVSYWSSQLGNSKAVVTQVRLDADGLFGLFEYSGGVVWSRLSKDFRDPYVRFRRLRIDADGNLRIYSWNNFSSTWNVGWQAIQNQCDVFGTCGLYGVCGYGKEGPSCDCLNRDSGPASCEKMPDLGNCDQSLSMTSLEQTLLYSLYPPHDIDLMMSVEDCRRYCLNDTTCFAATARNDGSGICTVKKTSFISGYHYSSVQAVSFLKVCLVPQAVSAQAANLHGRTRLPPMEEQTVAETIGGWRSYRIAVVVLLLVTGFVFLTVEMGVFGFILYKRRRLSAMEKRRIPFGKDRDMNLHYSALVRLSLEEVKEITKNFGNKLGPNVYRGMLPNKILVIVKVLDNVIASEKDFHLVVSSLGSTHHRNLVALKGFCYEPSHKLLLYEYASNGSLDEWLQSRQQNRRDGWSERLSIAIGIAKALAYLHLECKQCIPHGNLKLKNILLDDYLTPKLTYFGLQRLVKEDVASSSETVPERDVYMFGRILLQIVTGKIAISEKELCCLAYEVCNNGEFIEFADAQLKGRVEADGVERVVKLALWCVQDRPNLRPSIGEVVMVLGGALSLDMPPLPEASKMVANQSVDDNLDIVEVTL